MKVSNQINRVLVGSLMLLVLSGCGLGAGVIKTEPAIVGNRYETSTHKDLISLPAPKRKKIIAVYKFKDQTGQYKQGASGSSFSTAVTQGATAMLMKALEDAGKGSWFTSLEREGLSNLLNERKIIRSTRRQHKDRGGRSFPPLPSLLYAPMILEGGVIAYETNLVTGGFGARYLGVGANAQYRRDSVTISLRVISVKTGAVLKTVTTSKTILSRQLDVGLFKFVSFKKLLEVEAGLSANEPTQMAVLEAIEKAVYGLVVEGAGSNLWSFGNSIAGNQVISQYYAGPEKKLKEEDKWWGIRVVSSGRTKSKEVKGGK